MLHVSEREHLLYVIDRQLWMVLAKARPEELHASLRVREVCLRKDVAENRESRDTLELDPRMHAVVQGVRLTPHVDLHKLFRRDHCSSHVIGPDTASVSVPSRSVEMPASPGTKLSSTALKLQLCPTSGGNSITQSSVFPASA